LPYRDVQSLPLAFHRVFRTSDPSGDFPIGRGAQQLNIFDVPGVVGAATDARGSNAQLAAAVSHTRHRTPKAFGDAPIPFGPQQSIFLPSFLFWAVAWEAKLSAFGRHRIYRMARSLRDFLIEQFASH